MWFDVEINQSVPIFFLLLSHTFVGIWLTSALQTSELWCEIVRRWVDDEYYYVACIRVQVVIECEFVCVCVCLSIVHAAHVVAVRVWQMRVAG